MEDVSSPPLTQKPVKAAESSQNHFICFLLQSGNHPISLAASPPPPQKPCLKPDIVCQAPSDWLQSWGPPSVPRLLSNLDVPHGRLLPNVFPSLAS